MNNLIQSERGFTLIELLVAITIAGILSTIAIGSWNALRESNKVEAAADSLRSVLAATRIRSMSTGRAQQVTVNFIVNGGSPADSITSTLRNGGAFDAVSRVVGNERTFAAGVDWVNARAGVGTEPVCVVSTNADTFKTLQFNSRGTLQTLPGNKTRTIIVQDRQGANQFCIRLNNVTGRVDLQRL